MVKNIQGEEGRWKEGGRFKGHQRMDATEGHLREETKVLKKI